MKKFIRVKVDTYRQVKPDNPWEEQDDEDFEVKVCDCLLSIQDVQMVTNSVRNGRVAVMLTDSSIVTVLSTLEEFEKMLHE